EGYEYAAGVEEVVPPVALAVTGPSREAYESGRPVLVRNSPWASSFERGGLERERWTVGHGAAVFVSGPPGEQPHVSRSFVWVPVVSGDSITAMLSLQSYHEDAFSDWHVQLLQDLAPHVTLALANAEHFAQAQTERARLERLHVLELGVARASDERQLAEAIFDAAGRYIEASHMLLAYLDVAGNVVGFTGERDAPTGYLGPAALADAPFFRRLIEMGGTVAEAELESDEEMMGPVGQFIFSRSPSHVVWVPITQGERVVGGMAALRTDGGRFLLDHLKLLEAAATVVGIALRTMRLHHANELALAQSVRIQELAALAGHELMSVVANIADQARTMLESAGVVCWAFDTEGRISATRGSGDAAAEAVAAFTELDPTQPGRARAEMGRLVERALAATHGALWLLEDGHLVRRAPDSDELPAVPVTDSTELLRLLVSPTGSRRMRALLDLLGSPPDAFAIPIQVEG